MRYIKDHPKQGKWKVMTCENYEGAYTEYWNEGIIPEDESKNFERDFNTYREYHRGSEMILREGRYYKWEFRNNFIFEATFKPVGFGRGRSAVEYKLEDIDSSITERTYGDEDEKLHYIIRGKATLEMLQGIADKKIAVANGGFKGLWTFTKQGSNYTVLPYFEA